jgi:uncharacterized protein with PIN domain
MSDTLSCPECDEEIESTDELETGEQVPEVEEDDDGSLTLFQNHDLFLCKNCKKPLGMSRS